MLQSRASSFRITALTSACEYIPNSCSKYLTNILQQSRYRGHSDYDITVHHGTSTNHCRATLTYLSSFQYLLCHWLLRRRRRIGFKRISILQAALLIRWNFQNQHRIITFWSRHKQLRLSLAVDWFEFCDGFQISSSLQQFKNKFKFGRIFRGGIIIAWAGFVNVKLLIIRQGKQLLTICKTRMWRRSLHAWMICLRIWHHPLLHQT